MFRGSNRSDYPWKKFLRDPPRRGPALGLLLARVFPRLFQKENKASTCVWDIPPLLTTSIICRAYQIITHCFYAVSERFLFCLKHSAYELRGTLIPLDSDTFSLLKCHSEGTSVPEGTEFPDLVPRFHQVISRTAYENRSGKKIEIPSSLFTDQCRKSRTNWPRKGSKNFLRELR